MRTNLPVTQREFEVPEGVTLISAAAMALRERPARLAEVIQVFDGRGA